jgi:hypothetical protein
MDSAPILLWGLLVSGLTAFGMWAAYTPALHRERVKRERAEAAVMRCFLRKTEDAL